MAEPGGTTHMDVEEKTARFSFNVLQLVKTSQGEHGVKHHDYTRYRRYCTARLRRLYKSLKFTHGRGKYVKKPIVIANINDERFLHIILYLAERAWSYAMAIKQKSDGLNSVQKFHLLGRLSKAAKWAELFSSACAERADARTSLEATAYAAFLKGSYLVEREQQLETALKNFTIARKIYEELGKYGSVENQILCRQRVDDELEPSIRYCLYKMGRSDTSATDLSVLDDLQTKLEVVMADAKVHKTANLTELNWLGHNFSISNAKIRASIQKGQQLEKELDASNNILSSEKKLRIYDKIFTTYHDARRHIREDLVTADSAGDAKDNLNGLDKAVSCIILQRSMDRNQLLVTTAKNGINQEPSKEENSDKSSKPKELVRLYDLLIQNATDLSDLATSGREQNSEEASYAQELEIKKLAFQAERCFYLAQSHSSASKYAEAYLLYQRARDYADSALDSYHTMKNKDGASVEELKKLSQQCRVQSCLTHASAVALQSRTQSSLQKRVASISFGDENQESKTTRYLIERINEYDSVVGIPDSKEPPCIAQIPPAFQAVPCKPIVFDTAVNKIDFPPLENRYKKEDRRTSFFGFWKR